MLIFDFVMLPITIKAPGRINLIGEHTDYNDGLVLPAAINRYLTVNLKPNSRNSLILRALDLEEAFEVPLDSLAAAKEPAWINYFAGSYLESFKNRKPFGFEVSVTSDIPMGSGLSSSAALIVAAYLAFKKTLNLPVEDIGFLIDCQKIEHQYASVITGLMDYFASYLGQKDNAVYLDCKTLEYSYIPLEFEARGIAIVVCNSLVKRKLASSEYNLRRQQCV